MTSNDVYIGATENAKTLWIQATENAKGVRNGGTAETESQMQNHSSL